MVIFNMGKSKLQKIYDNKKISKLIEKSDSIQSVQGFKCAKIDNLSILMELGKSLYKVVSGYIFYDKFSNYGLDVIEIDKIVMRSQKDVNNDVYNTWLEKYYDDGIKLRYFCKELHDYHIYILISILYLECGIEYMFSIISDMIYSRLYYYIKYSRSKSCFDDYDSCLDKEKVERIAHYLSIEEDYYDYKELAHVISFSTRNNFNVNNVATYFGICATDFLAIIYVLKRFMITDVKELKYKKGLVLNISNFNQKIPYDIYKFLEIDEERINKKYEGKIVNFSRKIYITYFKVTAIKNIIGMLFANYILYNDDEFLRICERIFARYANVELSEDVLNYQGASRKFLFYYITINNLTYIQRPFQKGHMKNRIKIVETDDSNNENVIADFSNLSSCGVHKYVLNHLYNNYRCTNHLLRDELKIYTSLLENVVDSSNQTVKQRRTKIPQGDVHVKNSLYQHNESVDFCDSKNTLYIMKRTSTCQNRNHNVSSVTGVLKNLRGFFVRINVNYCANCKKFFINRIDFDEFCKRHGIMLGNFSVKELNFSKGFNGMYKLADESPLHYCGYNVNKQKGLTESDRHKILANIIDFNIMKKTEIIEYLHFYINNIGNRANMNLAVSKWEDDLYFVNNYRINKQKSYRIDKIRQK